MMDKTNELNRDVRGRIDAHLDAIDVALSAAGMSRNERRSITDDVEAQVLEMLSSRAGQAPTLADVEAVLAELDPPEAYARDDVVSPLPPPPVPMPTTVRPHFSRTAILGAVWAGLFLAILIPAAVLLFFRLDKAPSRPMKVAAHAQSRRSAEITTRRLESTFTQPGAVFPADETPAQLPATTNEFVDDADIPATSAPATHAPSGGSARPVWGISFFGLILFLPAILILGAPVGAMVLGLVAISQIRRSAGRLYGLGLALFDAIVFPLLLLDVAIFVLWGFLLHAIFGTQISGGPGGIAKLLTLAATVLMCLVVDFLLVRWAWRSVNRPHPASA